MENINTHNRLVAGSNPAEPTMLFLPHDIGIRNYR